MSVVLVAKKAGVAPSTVSRLIDQRGYVDEETAERVSSAMQAVGYNPPAVRRGRRPQHRQGVRNGRVVFLSLSSAPPANLYQIPKTTAEEKEELVYV